MQHRFRALLVFLASVSVATAGTLATVSVTCTANNFPLPVDPSKTITDLNFATYSTPCTTVGTPHGDATAAVAYGALAASAFTGPVDAPGTTSATAAAQFTDTLTIQGPTGTGFITFSFNLSYNGFTDVGTANSSFLFFENGAGAISSAASYPHGVIIVDPPNGPPPGTFGTPVTVIRTSAPIAYQFGHPVSIDARLNSSVSGGAGAIATAALTGIGVVDNASNPLSNFRITSASGALYAVPEPSPSSELLGGTALLAVFGCLVRPRQ